MPLTDFINSLEIQNLGYEIHSNDFGEVNEIIANKFVGVKLLQRPGKITNALVLGPYFPVEKDQGILFFVSKSNYPCFYPLFNIGRQFSQPQNNPGKNNLKVISTSNGSIQKLLKDQITNLIISYCKNLQVININQIAFILGSSEWESGFDNTIDNQLEKSSGIYGKYWGRGLSQITLQPNYIKFGGILKQDFVNNPDLVKNADYGAFILVYGMKNGSFTGLELDDFITSDLTLKFPESDLNKQKQLEQAFYNARQILTGRGKFQNVGNVQQLALNWRKRLITNG